MSGKFLPFKYYGAKGNEQLLGYKEEGGALRVPRGSCPGRDAARSAASQNRDPGQLLHQTSPWTPDQQRTTPQQRRVAQHPGNAARDALHRSLHCD